ncbi:flavin reductase like domain-containing protein [Phlyctochytrium arcticum]|nr:flavin reductase like domain-containing protein [Phlyctochytrium arcticum]
MERVMLYGARRLLPALGLVTRPLQVDIGMSFTFRRVVQSYSTNTTQDKRPKTGNLFGGELREIMRKVPSQVVVVTLTTNETESNHLGTTCSSFTSVSLDPPVVSFCIRHPSRTSTVLQQKTSSHFAIHILSRHQTQQSLAYSSPQTQHIFDTYPHHIDTDTKLPILHNCLGVLICKPVQSVQVGDHEVWFGEVSSIVHGVGSTKNGGKDMEPLVYYESSYRSVGDEVFMEQLEKGALSFDEWTHRAHLRMAWNYLREGSLEAAYPRVKRTVMNHNATNAHLIKHGYNDTITRFYLHLIHLAFKAEEAQNCNSDFLEFLAKYPFLEDQHVITRYFSPALLKSPHAKEEFVQPDLQALPTSVDEIRRSNVAPPIGE